jgi:hypothetical protein
MLCRNQLRMKPRGSSFFFRRIQINPSIRLKKSNCGRWANSRDAFLRYQRESLLKCSEGSSIYTPDEYSILTFFKELQCRHWTLDFRYQTFLSIGNYIKRPIGLLTAMPFSLYGLWLFLLQSDVSGVCGLMSESQLGKNID